MRLLKKVRTRWNLGLMLAAIVVIAVQATPATAKTIGMVADFKTQSAIVFDADADTVLGTVFLPVTEPGGSSIGDCSITADQSLGFVTDFNSEVHVIDLTTVSLDLAPNPIPISNNGEDTSISPDEQFLVVCDGAAIQPISVIDIATQTEVSNFDLGHDCNSVDVCSDGSVLVTSFRKGTLRRLTIDGAGKLTDTGDSLDTDSRPNNVFCAPDAKSGIVITREGGDILSFTIPFGVAFDSTRTLTGSFGLSGQINPAGDRAFALSNPGAVDVFDYTAAPILGADPLFTIQIKDTPKIFFAMDQMALHPNGNKLYVSQPSAVNVYNASTGEPLTTITDPNIDSPTGVCFAASRQKKRAVFLMIDEDSIDNGNQPEEFSDEDVNDDIADIGLRAQLRFFAAAATSDDPDDNFITLHTGEVGDEGWFALTTIPDSWAKNGPSDDGLSNYVGVTNLKGKIKVGKGLGRGKDPESKIDKIPDVTPLRATGLAQLVGQTVCAVVQDSDVSMNYDPLNGSLKGESLGRVAFEVLSVTELTGYSSSSLPEVEIKILDADKICEGELGLFLDAPEPESSSEPFDVEVEP